MIGKIYSSRFPFYDAKQHKMSYKGRPVLIIGAADSSDFNVLPVSSVTNPQHLHPDYDIPLDPATYPLLGLTKKSYVRVHKQSIVNSGNIVYLYGDLKGNYPDTYLHILTTLEVYVKTLLDLAL